VPVTLSLLTMMTVNSLEIFNKTTYLNYALYSIFDLININ